MRSRIFTLVPPTATFVVGLLVSISTDVFGKSYITGTLGRLVLVGIVAILILLGGLFIMSGLHYVHLQEQSVGLDRQLTAIESQLNLSAEFIDDRAEGGGMSYERTAELVRNAAKSVRCVDLWVQPPAGPSGGQRSTSTKRMDLERTRRKKYYETLEERMKLFRGLGSSRDVFYKRIIQVEKDADLTVDSQYHDHLLVCLDAEGGQDAASIRVAKPQILINFTIIDDRYVIWPVMTVNPATHAVERIGAIFFNDPGEQLVNTLRSLFHRLDSRADALTAQHLALGSPS